MNILLKLPVTPSIQRRRQSTQALADTQREISLLEFDLTKWIHLNIRLRNTSTRPHHSQFQKLFLQGQCQGKHGARSLIGWDLLLWQLMRDIMISWRGAVQGFEKIDFLILFWFLLHKFLVRMLLWLVVVGTPFIRLMIRYHHSTRPVLETRYGNFHSLIITCLAM